MKMPFLFQVTDEPVGSRDDDKTYFPDKFVVKISTFDYKQYDSRWMDDEKLPSTPYRATLVPDVDQTEETHMFDSEIEALRFIHSWWRSEKRYKDFADASYVLAEE